MYGPGIFNHKIDTIETVRPAGHSHEHEEEALYL
ncbi:hypothetical protein CfE428DRAFT_6411 [Chthoniobacter flavus Ellin428]|uniref:Uncharacterized protein n=1 Tax=Chthoniobacter flavus Ellin428 TaxID=497964 RepID=B4DBX0_9BACT|nr:hypothetical protein CfE428DRAFT_6411 [Chthoniobacter flavus Ellin428]TCO83863.1 hypothetical protein EV701_14019 [Chthoniobacter flavus]